MAMISIKINQQKLALFFGGRFFMAYTGKLIDGIFESVAATMLLCCIN
jgi:hypothetical protein